MGFQPFWKLCFAYYLLTLKHDTHRKVTFSEPLLNPKFQFSIKKKHFRACLRQPDGRCPRPSLVAMVRVSVCLDKQIDVFNSILERLKWPLNSFSSLVTLDYNVLTYLKRIHLIIDCLRETAPILSVFSMHFATSFIWKTRTVTAFWFIFSIPYTLEDDIDNDSFVSNAPST